MADHRLGRARDVPWFRPRSQPSASSFSNRLLDDLVLGTPVHAHNGHHQLRTPSISFVPAAHEQLGRAMPDRGYPFPTLCLKSDPGKDRRIVLRSYAKSSCHSCFSFGRELLSLHNWFVLLSILGTDALSAHSTSCRG